MKLEINTNKITCPLSNRFKVNGCIVTPEDFGKLEEEVLTADELDALDKDSWGGYCNSRTFVGYFDNPELRKKLGITIDEYTMIVKLLGSIPFESCAWCQ